MAAVCEQKIKENTVSGIVRKGENNMNTNYFRITGYCEQDNFCFIMDCYGMFEKLWQFSSFLITKGLKVLEVGNAEKFSDCNISRIPPNTDQLSLRAIAHGKPEYTTQQVDGVTYKAVKVADKIYVPNKKELL